MKWSRVPLGEVVEFLDHLRKPVTARDRVEGPYPYYGANGQQGTINGYLFDEELLLLAEDGGHFNDPERGIAYKISGPSWVNNHAHVLRMKQTLDLGYAHWAVRNLDVRRYTSGTTRAKLTKSGAAAIEIPLPPLDEQRRIAAILDQVEMLRAKRRQSALLVEVATQEIYLHEFGDPVQNSMNWPSGTLGDQATKITDGEHKTPRRSESGVPLLSARSIQSGWIDFEATDFVPAEEYEVLRRRIQPQTGDILISCSGTIGRVAQVRERTEFAMVRSAALVRPGPDLSPGFLEQQLSAAPMKALMNLRANSSAQANLFQNQIRSLPVVIPPLDHQKEFERRIEAVARQRKLAMSSLTQLDDLFASLQARAFRGEL